MHAYAANEDLWYLGKGARENTFLKYRISDSFIDNGSPFEMTIYFKTLLNEMSWEAVVFEYRNGKIVNGTAELDNQALNLSPIQESSSQLIEFGKSYARTIQWLGSSSYAIRPGQLLVKDWQWRSATELGGSPLTVDSFENIAVPAGTYSSALIKLVSNSTNLNIWVNKDLPYPVKGEYSSTQTRYSYELLEVGEGFPTSIPEFPFSVLMLALGLGVTFFALHRGNEIRSTRNLSRN